MNHLLFCVFKAKVNYRRKEKEKLKGHFCACAHFSPVSVPEPQSHSVVVDCCLFPS